MVSLPAEISMNQQEQGARLSHPSQSQNVDTDMGLSPFHVLLHRVRTAMRRVLQCQVGREKSKVIVNTSAQSSTC